jgi:N-acetyl-alpha-D-muramate 1-phosphate uridylyltransferase
MSGHQLVSTEGAQALVLAAGRGERMRPLTDTTPKPLLKVRGKPLIDWHLAALAAGGVRQVVVNAAWLGQQMQAHVADGSAWGLSAVVSREDLDFGAALETLGGVCRAAPLLADTFWLAAADVFVPGFAFADAQRQRFAAGAHLAHLWLVPNPAHHPAGDFGLDAITGLAMDVSAGQPAAADRRYTYSTIALMKRELLAPPWCDIPLGNPQGLRAPLAPLLRRAMRAQRVSAQLWTGPWADVGTPDRLAQLQAASLP